MFFFTPRVRPVVFSECSGSAVVWQLSSTEKVAVVLVARNKSSGNTFTALSGFTLYEN